MRTLCKGEERGIFKESDIIIDEVPICVSRITSEVENNRRRHFVALVESLSSPSKNMRKIDTTKDTRRKTKVLN